jgi:hypothetical protein
MTRDTAVPIVERNMGTTRVVGRKNLPDEASSRHNKRLHRRCRSGTDSDAVWHPLAADGWVRLVLGTSRRPRIHALAAAHRLRDSNPQLRKQMMVVSKLVLHARCAALQLRCRLAT